MHPSTIIFPSPFLPVNFLSSFRPNFSNENKTNENWLFRREGYPWLKWYPIRRNLNFSKVCLATFFFLTFSTFNAFIGRFVFVHPWILRAILIQSFFTVYFIIIIKLESCISEYKAETCRYNNAYSDNSDNETLDTRNRSVLCVLAEIVTIYIYITRNVRSVWSRRLEMCLIFKRELVILFANVFRYLFFKIIPSDRSSLADKKSKEI